MHRAITLTSRHGRSFRVRESVGQHTRALHAQLSKKEHAILWHDNFARRDEYPKPPGSAIYTGARPRLETFHLRHRFYHLYLHRQSRCYSTEQHPGENVKTMAQQTFYDLKAELPGADKYYDFADLKGKVVLIVNVASKCGFTPQYTGLEKLHQKYKDRDFVILGFPCNQFGGQEPGTDEDIGQFCQLNHGVTFPLMKKSDVNGDNTNEVYKWLKNEKAGILGLTRIKWNFEKFLVGKDGKVLNRWASTTSPEAIDAEIEKALNTEL